MNLRVDKYKIAIPAAVIALMTVADTEGGGGAGGPWISFSKTKSPEYRQKIPKYRYYSVQPL